MNRFPPFIVESMRQSGAMTTCVPLEFDQGGWQSTVFFELGGKECKEDRRLLRKTTSPLAIGIEADIIEHTNAAVVMLRFEVMTTRENPLVGEVLLAPGMGDVQFETLKYLSNQPSLKFYFGDSTYHTIHSQQIALNSSANQGYGELLDEAVSHDALIRLTGKYDAMLALREVVDHYETR